MAKKYIGKTGGRDSGAEIRSTRSFIRESIEKAGYTVEVLDSGRSWCVRSFSDGKEVFRGKPSKAARTFMEELISSASESKDSKDYRELWSDSFGYSTTEFGRDPFDSSLGNMVKSGGLYSVWTESDLHDISRTKAFDSCFKEGGCYHSAVHCLMNMPEDRVFAIVKEDNEGKIIGRVLVFHDEDGEGRNWWWIFSPLKYGGTVSFFEAKQVLELHVGKELFVGYRRISTDSSAMYEDETRYCLCDSEMQSGSFLDIGYEIDEAHVCPECGSEGNPSSEHREEGLCRDCTQEYSYDDDDYF